MKKYELVNAGCCLMDKVESTSFKKAREYFANRYEGKFRIICEGETKNVILK